MNVLVLHTQVPFVRGGAEALVEGLVMALRERGHMADIVALPLSWNPVERLLTSALAWRLLDVTRFNDRVVDRVICTKYPTWAVAHPRKSLWLVHQHRQAYDLHGTALSEFGPNEGDEAVRRHVVAIDQIGIADCNPRFAISRNVSERLRRFCGIASESLYPPVPHRGLRPLAYEPFILCAARLDAAKRVDRVVEAWPLVSHHLRLVIAGDGPERARIESLVRRHGLTNRVSVLGRVSDAELVDLYNRCRAVVYAPVDEDYGYSAVEALAAAKPVITAPDSGGVLEFVADGVTGVVTTLDSQALADAIARLSDERTARALGEAGPAMTATLNWDDVVERLLDG